MKINEIEYGHWNKPSIPESDTMSPNKIGEYDGVDVHLVTRNNQRYFMVLNRDNTYQGYISVKPGYVFVEAYVSEQNRRKGICSILILFVLRVLKKKLVLSKDEIVTDDSRRLFYTLAKMNKIRITSKNKTVDPDTLSKIFADVRDNDYRLVIESQARKGSDTCFEIRDRTGSACVQGMQFGSGVREPKWYD